jgi:protein Mpv17
MASFALKAAVTSRALLRRPHHLPRHIAKRLSSTKTSAPKSNAAPIENGTAIPVPATVANLPLWQRLGPLTRGFEAYARSQRNRPYTTQFFSSLVIYFLGDMSAQNISGEPYDPLRTVRALIIGAGSSIPSYKWYEHLISCRTYL